MLARLLLLSTTLIAGGVLASPALAEPPDRAQSLPTDTVEACGSTLLVEEVRNTARERVTESDTAFRAHVHGNAVLRVTDLESGETAIIRAPGSAKITGTFDPETGGGTIEFDLRGQTVLLPEPYSLEVEVQAQAAFGLPEFAIVYGPFQATTTFGPEGPVSASIHRTGNRVVDVCDLLR